MYKNTNDLQKGCWLLAIQFLLPQAADVSDFPTLPLDGSIELKPCDRCFGTEWIAGLDTFPIHGLT